ncbi:uncharacterized protein EV422DRAFT_193268 [Fimicolochytrium jonesii]|uniref:uncharacterized protein n=1 Tax=Fimicolochytrium jonesii TaxID=1396493 RepID=UPI0022FE69C9|nr:uncharacterized protein EV422DRAFT_193268 [Fimicolochytrium jonesii]KAI8818177.1 hypothetical protein EV422DRAFT_193268 [Fimicolochytrium jonesii]
MTTLASTRETVAKELSASICPEYNNIIALVRDIRIRCPRALSVRPTDRPNTSGSTRGADAIRANSSIEIPVLLRSCGREPMSYVLTVGLAIVLLHSGRIEAEKRCALSCAVHVHRCHVLLSPQLESILQPSEPQVRTQCVFPKSLSSRNRHHYFAASPDAARCRSCRICCAGDTFRTDFRAAAVETGRERQFSSHTDRQTNGRPQRDYPRFYSQTYCVYQEI